MTRSFEELDCWKKGRDLRLCIAEVCKIFPSSEKYRLVDQMIRSSRSVTNNIAEGYGRYHFKENIQFCRHSRGSLFELKDHIGICLEERYIDVHTYEKLNEMIVDVIIVLNGYIKFLSKYIDKN